MPTPKTHYRIALGENNGQHSWIIHSAKGIKWHNIPDELVTLLQKLSVNELLDFSLGSDGRWYVRYRQKGPEKHEISPYLWMDLGQGSSIKLDRLTLGPDTDHWGVHRAADGSFQRLSSVGNRHQFTQELDAKIQTIQSNNQIWFVSLGFSGNWAFSVNGFVRHRCGKPFHNELSGGWKAHKRVSTIVLSPMARVWIIVWEDGTLSHNLPSNIATDVEDYCQLQHSLKANSNGPNPGRPKPRKAKHPRNNQQGTGSAAQKQKSTNNSTRTANPAPTQNNAPNPTQQSSAQQAINNLLNVASATAAPFSAPPPVPPAVNVLPVPQPPIIVTSTSTHKSTARQVVTQPVTSSIQVPSAPSAPVQAGWSSTQPTSQVPLTRQNLDSFSSAFSISDRRFSRAEVGSTASEIYVAPKKLKTTLRVLDSSGWTDSAEYKNIARLFEDGWKHPEKPRPKIKKILVVELPDHLNESFQEYKDTLERQNGWSGVNEQLVFHGTSRNCSIGEGDGYIGLCEKSTCVLCCILKTSFLVSKCASAGRAFMRFGPGIYTSSVSSKADDYTKTPWYSDDRVIIVARVALGKSSIHYRTTESLTEPPIGYDSVLGEVGIHLNYNEQVLYKDEAIRPAYIIVYERGVGAPAVSAPRPPPRPAPQSTWTNPAPTTTNSSSSSGCTIM